MKKFVLIPDSFKGTMSSEEVCGIMENSIKKLFFDADVISVPIADGGEGSVDCLIKACGGKKVQVTCEGPFMEKIESFYGMLPDNTAVIEMAACCGLVLVKDRKNPGKTTTFGVGTLIKNALFAGAKKIIICLGGSSTNDGGCGAAAALGVKFYDALGNAFIPVGDTLCDIAKIDASGLISELLSTEIITMCDITNPLYGKNGAAYIFAPQKGADESEVILLDKGLYHLSECIKRDLGVDVSAVSGAGAAGGMGAGTMAFFKSKLCSGIKAVLSLVQFDKIISDADYIFTGEGKIDSQSAGGKALSGIADAAKKQNKTVIALCGCDESTNEIFDMGISAVFSINRKAQDFSQSAKHSKENLAATMDNILRLL